VDVANRTGEVSQLAILSISGAKIPSDLAQGGVGSMEAPADGSATLDERLGEHHQDQVVPEGK